MRVAGVGRLSQVTVALLCLNALASCVLADPAPTLPLVAELPPTVDLASVYPPAGPGAVISTWPAYFSIPVYETDPSAPLAWIAYYGYSSLPGVPGDTPQDSPKSFPANIDAGLVRTATFRLAEPQVACQTILIVVANTFNGYNPQVPDPDYAYVSWLYAPSGNATDCNVYDAGYLFDATFPSDATGDATLTDGGP